MEKETRRSVLTKLADFCRVIACAFAALTVGLFLWTLFWSLFIIFVGGGPISRECSQTSTHLPGLIMCVQYDLATDLGALFVPDPSRVGCNEAKPLSETFSDASNCAVRGVQKLGSGLVALLKLPVDVLLYRDYSTCYAIRDAVYATGHILVLFADVFSLGVDHPAPIVRDTSREE